MARHRAVATHAHDAAQGLAIIVATLILMALAVWLVL